ncbi:MAG: glycosyltransferase family 4 protein [Polyangiaceae bacterium]|nr:glycosyltransferase family 4 protein [Polyangiaceae bacterium]
MSPRVLFVSKAVAPPFHDGAICYARDLAGALANVTPTVLSSNDAPEVGPTVCMHRIYRKPSRFSPPKLDNLRVLLHLLCDTNHDIWHFVFAPNPASSNAAKLVKTVRRRPIVQTIASRPKHFEKSSALVFGDRVIALSQYTADQLTRNGVRAPVSVIRVPIADISRSKSQQESARATAGIELDVPLIVYAGDLEFSNGADVMVDAIPAVLREVPSAVIAFACRMKTPRAVEKKHAIESRFREMGPRVRFVGEVPDLPALIASACALPFPVDDLYAKIDHPYVVLESALLQVPVMVPKGGPLEEIRGIQTMENGDTKSLVGWCVDMARDDAARKQVGAALRESVLLDHDPQTVARNVTTLYMGLMS